MQFITRELMSWPRPVTKNRKRSPYSLTYDRVLNHMERELERLGVNGDVVIQVDTDSKNMRRDGLLHSDEKVRTPRVAIAFDCRFGPLTYYCDRYWEWTGNVRAIGLGLERLRLVEETGIVSRGEQYTGFKALPSGIPMGAGMTPPDAAAFLWQLQQRLTIAISKGEGILAQKPAFDAAYRGLAMRLHPDGQEKPGWWTVDDWHRLQEAAEILEKHHANRRPT